MGSEFERLHQNEVVSIQPENFEQLDIANIFKVVDILEAIQEFVGVETTEAPLFLDGMNCEVLKFGANGWKKGKVRITLEFCPDEPESPLDDLRDKLRDVES